MGERLSIASTVLGWKENASARVSGLNGQTLLANIHKAKNCHVVDGIAYVPGNQPINHYRKGNSLLWKVIHDTGHPGRLSQPVQLVPGFAACPACGAIERDERDHDPGNRR